MIPFIGIMNVSIGILIPFIGIMNVSIGILIASVGILIHWYFEHWYFERWYFESLPFFPHITYDRLCALKSVLIL